MAKSKATALAPHYVKCHICTGVNTNVVTAAVITGQDSNDSPHLPGLVKTTSGGFRVDEVSADKAYLSNDNIEAILAAGASPYIAFKANSTGGVGGEFEKLFHLFSLNREASVVPFSP
jgi:Transposase DDE domain